MENKEEKISEILNLIGYGLAKFDLKFINEFGFKTKTSFNQFIVDTGLAKTTKAVSNRQDTFDPYFDNGRKGWWQRRQREHIKLFIDSLFGNEDVKAYANIVKLYMLEYDTKLNLETTVVTPITKSKFRQLQETGNEAEFYFIKNYASIPNFQNGIIEDARLWGDGYDFQIQIENEYLLTEVKGLRTDYGAIRFTENEYEKANEFTDKYFLIVISNLSNTPKMSVIQNPIIKFSFTPKEIIYSQKNYHSQSLKW